jgi:hypothetical protein
MTARKRPRKRRALKNQSSRRDKQSLKTRHVWAELAKGNAWKAHKLESKKVES